MRLLFTILILLVASPAMAHRTAQQAAEASAAGGLRHRGGNPSYEGLGCSSSPESAFRSCCYANSSNLITYDVGIAQGRNGLWVCCRRYISRSSAHRIPELLSRAGLKKQRTCVADCFEPTEKVIKVEEVDE
jgi:hypothetical protein